MEAPEKPSRKRLILIAATIAVACITGLVTVKLRSSRPLPQTVPLASTPAATGMTPAGFPLPNASAADAGGAAVARLMTRYGLDPEGAAYIAQVQGRVLDRTEHALHFTLSFPGGVSSDNTLTLTPNESYTPSGDDGGARAHDVKFSVRAEGDASLHLSLRYVVPNGALPDQLPRLTAWEGADVFSLSLIPTALAEGSPGTGIGVSQETVVSIAQAVLSQQAAKGQLSKEFPTPLTKMLDVLNALKKQQDHLNWMNELDEIARCAQDPSNPLTRKAFEENPAYRDQVLQGIRDARSDIMSMSAMRFLNLGSQVATDLVEGPLGAVTGKVADQNDETLKNLAEQRVKDAGKGTTRCQNPPLRPGNARSIKGTVEYKYNRSSTYCEQGNCTHQQDTRHLTGEFVLLAATLPGVFMNGGGGATYERLQVHGGSNSKCNWDGKDTVTGTVPVSTEGGGSPLAGWIRLTLGGDGLAGTTEANSNCGSGGPRHQHREWQNGGLSLGCEFNEVDFVHGGSYAMSVVADSGYGTCIITIAPR